MKKVLSFALALVMVFAVAVPAFAVDEIVRDDKSVGNTTTVLVYGASATATYTVTIPATVTIPWGETSTDVNYSVFCQLKTGYYVKVTAESADKGVMTNQAKTATLNYSLSDTTYTTTKSVVLDTAPETATVKVLIPASNWNGASIDNYSGTLTFNAELTTKQ